MRALVFDTFGGPDVLSVRELLLPTAREGEVVVKVAAATVNPTDLLMRSGEQAAAMKSLSPPFIAGMEFAGHVHEVGAGVASLRKGQRVMGIVNPRRVQGGAQQEYVSAPAASVVPVPDETDLVEAATVPMNGLTAKVALELLALRRGDSLLVTGAAGAVGGYVIELAKSAGLTVVADAKESDRELVLGLGATKVVPRGDLMRDAVRSEYPQGVDGLVDGALLGDAAASLVRDGGAVAAVRRTSLPTDPRVRGFFVSVMEHAHRTDALMELARLLEQRQLTPRVAVRLPVERGADAHRLLEKGGLRGRVVVTF